MTMKDKDRYFDCLNRALEASSQGSTEDALAWFDEALKAEPNGAEAHNGRGEILWDEGKPEEAAYEFELATMADPKLVQAHLNLIELLTEDLLRHDEAIRRCDDLLAGRPELPRADRATEAEIHYLKARALFSRDDLEGALFLVRRASKTVPDVAAYRAFEGQIAFELGRFDEARRHLEHAVYLDPESSYGHYYLALAFERLGRPEEAQAAFRKANALDPEQWLLPAEMDHATFERAAAAALADLPRSIREYVEDIPVLIEELPSEELIREEGISPQALGLFIGVPRTEAAITAQARDVDRVILFKKNLEKWCRDQDELVEQIHVTVKHEIGHYLGFTEEDLERLGLA
jgi:predicted Zn-dependent protease with MMP-like domain